MSEEMNVVTENLRAHSSKVEAVVDRLHTAVEAAQQVSLSNDACGVLRRPFAWMLDSVEDHGVETSRTAVRQQVREHGDGIGVNDLQHDSTPGSDELPEGLSRTNPDPHGLAGPGGANDPKLIYRDVDVADESNALWRACRLDDERIDEIFRDGLLPRDPNGKADFEALDGHVPGNTRSRWVSTSVSLEHVLRRGQQDAECCGAILKLRTGGGAKWDATLHDRVGDKPSGCVSHGETGLDVDRRDEGRAGHLDLNPGAPLALTMLCHDIALLLIERSVESTKLGPIPLDRDDSGAVGGGGNEHRGHELSTTRGARW